MAKQKQQQKKNYFRSSTAVICLMSCISRKSSAGSVLEWWHHGAMWWQWQDRWCWLVKWKSVEVRWRRATYVPPRFIVVRCESREMKWCYTTTTGSTGSSQMCRRQVWQRQNHVFKIRFLFEPPIIALRVRREMRFKADLVSWSSSWHGFVLNSNGVESGAIQFLWCCGRREWCAALCHRRWRNEFTYLWVLSPGNLFRGLTGLRIADSIWTSSIVSTRVAAASAFNLNRGDDETTLNAKVNRLSYLSLHQQAPLFHAATTTQHKENDLLGNAAVPLKSSRTKALSLD